MTRLLMCPPDYYALEYEINPWMAQARRRGEAVDREQARRQWQALYRVLTQEMDATVELLPPVPGLPDLVFTANAGLVQGRKFISSSFRYPERAREEPHFLSWLQNKGFQVVRLPPGLPFEGEGDILTSGQDLFAGYLFRSDIRSHLAVAEALGRRALSLELVDPRFYHLDTCFCPLGDGRVAYYPDAFDGFARRVILEHSGELIEVDEEEALRFACNAVVIGRQVAMSAGCPRLKAALEDRDYRVHEVEMSEFIKAGGAAKCLVLFLER